MFEALQYPFFQRALAAGLLASLACGVVGSYVVVKRMASIAGGISHSAFGGVGLGYLLGFDPMLGATGAALLSGVGIGVAYRRLRVDLDSLIAMVWSTGMALGILFIAMSPGYAPDLMSYLFGSILFVPAKSVILVGVLDLVILAVVLCLYVPLKAVSFDEDFSQVMGLPVGPLFHLLLALSALVVVVLIRVVGVILVIALLTIPASIARQWSDRLSRMMILGTLVAAACTTSGLWLSYGLSQAYEVQAPAGPLIVLIAIVLYGASSAARAFTGRRRAASA
jgi:zinc transport system permease protein